MCIRFQETVSTRVSLPPTSWQRMPVYPPDQHGHANRPTSHVRRRSSTSTLPQTALLLRPEDARPLGRRRKSGGASPRRRIGRLVGVGALVLLAVLSLLLLPGRSPARRASTEAVATAGAKKAAVSEQSRPQSSEADNSKPRSPVPPEPHAPHTSMGDERTSGLGVPDQDLAELDVCEKTVLFRFAGKQAPLFRPPRLQPSTGTHALGGPCC